MYLPNVTDAVCGHTATRLFCDSYDWGQQYPIVDADGTITGLTDMSSAADEDYVMVTLDEMTGAPVSLGGDDAALLLSSARRRFSAEEVMQCLRDQWPDLYERLLAQDELD